MTHAPSADIGDPHTALATLNARVDELVQTAGAEHWNTPTPAQGWDIAMQVAHLNWTDETSLTAIGDADGFAALIEKALADPGGFVDAGAAEIAPAGRDEVLARWRRARGALAEALAAADPGEKIPWFGPPMRPASMTTARIMETWAHGTDIADALGVAVDTDPAFTAALPHVAKLGYKTRGFAYSMNGLEPPTSEIHVRLGARDGTALEFGTPGAELQVTGPLLDFCLLVTQRVHREDTALTTVGDEAEQWLQIAQAFAGQSGGGREKGARA